MDAALAVDGALAIPKLAKGGLSLLRGGGEVAEATQAASRVENQLAKYGGDISELQIAGASEGALDTLLSESSLSTRQVAIHATLSERGAMAQFSKRSVSMADLRAIGRVTGDEYSMFTLKGTRTIIRGYGTKVYAPTQEVADALRTGQYGRWSGHTHPPGYEIRPSFTDRDRIPVGQNASAVWGDEGVQPFGRTEPDDFIIQREIRRKQNERYYGKQD